MTEPTAPSELRVLSYNIQVGIGSQRYRHYISHGWKYVMPHGQSLRNLARIGEIIQPFDIIGLQEADAGSFRTGFVDQARHLASEGGFPFCRSIITRDFGRFAQHTNSLLSRLPVHAVQEHRLPGAMDGRGVLEAQLSLEGRSLSVFVPHFALRPRTRRRQAHFLARRVRAAGSAVVMGDFNARPDSPEMQILAREGGLWISKWAVHGTLPSWRPRSAVDHILVTPDLAVTDYGPLPEVLSDHLPIHARIHWNVGPAT